MSTTYPFWLGGVAASLAATCTHPLDVTKVRMQTMQTAPGSKHPSTLAIIRSSIANHGLRSLYAGLTASLMRQMSYSLVRLGTYDKMKDHLTARAQQHGKHKPSTFQLLVAASLAGGMGGIAGNPADIILVRMTSDTIRPPEKRYNYSNGFAGLLNLIREEGFQGLSRGLGTNTVRAVLMNASQVGSYDFVKTTFLGKQLPMTDYKFSDNLILHLVSSVFAGTFATTVCSPADVLRSRLMASNCDQSFLQVLSESFRKEGVMFLFKGWTPAFVRLGPNTVLMFVFYEQIRSAWRAYASPESHK